MWLRFKKVGILPCALFSCAVFAEQPESTSARISGNVGLVSQYVFRGGVENDHVALQGGLEYSHPLGFSVGYWGSTLDYDLTDATRKHGIEHDLYFAYAQTLNAAWNYNVQLTAYAYQQGGTVIAENGEQRKTTAYDLATTLNYNNLSLNAVLSLSDATYVNAGDLYFGLSYRHALQNEFYIQTSAGVSVYNDWHDDHFIQTQQSITFNEARFGLLKNFNQTAMSMQLDYILGGKNRLAERYDNHWVLALNYAF